MRVMTNSGPDTALNTMNLTLGLALAGAPWMFGFRSDGVATWNAGLSAAVVVGAALTAINQTYDWEEWLMLVTGLWTATSPWLLGFASNAPAMWSHVCFGLAVTIISAVELTRVYAAAGATRT